MIDHPLHILEWLADMGDDVPLADAPINRFGESEMAQKAASERATSAGKASTAGSGGSKGSLQDRVAAIKQTTSARIPAKQAAVLPDESVVTAASKAAASAETIEALKAAIRGFEGCNLRLNAKNSVFASGDPNAKLLLIDEHPGRDEDQSGEPFAGRSGSLLQKMLAAIGLTLDDTYRVAALPWHPPGNRSPTLPELEICKPFLKRHLSLAKPKLIITMGNTPARMLIESNSQVLSLRGKWMQSDMISDEQHCLATLNPGFLLKQPAQKKLAWFDLLMIKSKLAES
ncbi:MAG: uracil-DNA glycosylase [Salaquimonas sp.]